MFQRDWALSNTGAGWVSGIYCAGYLAAAIGPPVLRRLDPSAHRRGPC
ncbi:MAG: hypothetical protein MI785_09595 [Kiloniellales bacterium]|nr:hypothetical protein [Kiloniellales bacterium]